MKWNGDHPEEETRTAMTAGDTVYSHGGLFHAYHHDGKVYGGCTVDGCEGCDLQFDSIEDYFNWLKDT